MVLVSDESVNVSVSVHIQYLMCTNLRQSIKRTAMFPFGVDVSTLTAEVDYKKKYNNTT